MPERRTCPNLDTLVVTVQPCLVDQLIADPGHGAFRPPHNSSAGRFASAGADGEGTPKLNAGETQGKAVTGARRDLLTLLQLSQTGTAGVPLWRSAGAVRKEAHARVARTGARACESIRVGSCARSVPTRCGPAIALNYRRTQRPLAIAIFPALVATCAIAGAKSASSINESGARRGATNLLSRWRLGLPLQRRREGRAGELRALAAVHRAGALAGGVPRPAPANGRAWYRRTFELSAEWLGRAVFLRFGAVNYHAKVLVNRTLVTEHEGGWLPFEVDIGAVLRPGVNEVAVHVTAPTDDPAAYPEYPFSEIPAGKQSWYGPLGGIWQPVLLERRALDHIRLVRLRPGRGVVEVRLASHARCRSRTTSSSDRRPDGRTAAATDLALAAGGAGERVPSGPEPLDWSPDAPHLYELAGGAAARRRSRRRPGALRLPLDRDPRRSDLPQRPAAVPARRARSGLLPDGICTPPSEAFRGSVPQAKALGLNCLRCHIKVPDPRYYAVADRVGLLIWTELPNAGRLTAQARVRAEATLHGILERDGNHPSIFCWTIINENWGTDLVHSAEDRAWLRRTVDWLKAADPDRLVVDNSPIAPSFHLRSDLEDFHFYAAIPDHRRSWDGFVEALPPGRPGPTGRAPRSFAGDEPLLCSEFGNWGLPDRSACGAPTTPSRGGSRPRLGRRRRVPARNREPLRTPGWSGCSAASALRRGGAVAAIPCAQVPDRDHAPAAGAGRM